MESMKVRSLDRKEKAMKMEEVRPKHSAAMAEDNQPDGIGEKTGMQAPRQASKESASKHQPLDEQECQALQSMEREREPWVDTNESEKRNK